MMKQQNSEQQAEQLHELPEVKSFIHKPLKCYQKQATRCQRKMRLCNFKTYIYSCLIFKEPIISMVTGCFLSSDVKYLKHKMSEAALFLELTLRHVFSFGCWHCHPQSHSSQKLIFVLTFSSMSFYKRASWDNILKLSLLATIYLCESKLSWHCTTNKTQP